MANEIDYNLKGENLMVETPQELIDKTAEKVEAALNKKFPDHIKFDTGSYTITRGSTQVMIQIRPFTENETCVECIANVVIDANVDQELMKFLLRKNAELHIGGFGLLFDNTIIFQHSITGTNLDENELVTSINTVAVIADHYDDLIVEKSGGKRATDVVEDLEN
jgi:hypothetical protein